MNKPKRREGKLESLPLEIRNIMNDILGIAGALYFVTYEEYLSKVKTLLPPLGLTADTYTDLKRDLTNPIDRLHKTAHRFCIRMSPDHAFEENQNDQYALALAFKALCRLQSHEIADEAIRITRNTPNFTTRGHFMQFFDAVLEKSRTSNHDAIGMIQKLYDALKEDAKERVIYDYNLKDFKLSNIEFNERKE